MSRSKISIDDIETNIKPIPKCYLKWIRIKAKKFSYLSLRTYVGCQDIIKAIVRAHAALNQRSEVSIDDIAFVSMVQPYLIDPYSPYDGLIVELWAENNLSSRQICEAIGKSKNYHTHVERIIEKAKLRGILPPEKEVEQSKEEEISWLH